MLLKKLLDELKDFDPERTEVVLEVYDENAPAHEDLYEFYVDSIDGFKKLDGTDWVEVRLCLQQNSTQEKQTESEDFMSLTEYLNPKSLK